MFSLICNSSNHTTFINMKLFPRSTIAIVVLSVSSAVARRTGRGWNRDDDWGGASKSSKTAQPTFYPTLSPTYSPTLGKSSKSWWGGWKDDDDDDWKGWRGYNHKKQYMKKFHHKRRNGKYLPTLNNAGIGSLCANLLSLWNRSSQPLGSRSRWNGT